MKRVIVGTCIVLGVCVVLVAVFFVAAWLVLLSLG